MTIKEEALQFAAKYIHNDMNDPLYVAFFQGAQCEAVQTLVNAMRVIASRQDMARIDPETGGPNRIDLIDSRNRRILDAQTAIEAWDLATK